MAERGGMEQGRGGWTDDALGAALTDLATRLELPGAGRLPDAIVLELDEPSARRRRSGWRRAMQRPAWRAVGLALVALVLAALVTLGVSPTARARVRSWIGVEGVRIQSNAAPPGTAAPRPAPTVAPYVDALQLGTPMSATDAAARLGRQVAVPHQPGLGAPDVVLFGHPPDSGQVSMVWAPGGDILPTPTPGVGLLLTQFEGRLTGMFVKLVPTGTRVERVFVNGDEAWWVHGDLHELIYEKPDGSVVTAGVRLAGDTLLWTRAGVTFRLESALERDGAIALAASVR